ncbi:nitrogen assimilation transcriptional regulator NAC [Pigmentiphaga soli]|uniref:Nitrogen assimilation transcriptional regulator NAC n=1 Tax=Pigmentiphaga soli TaxID=1007095 RepID=A0ABP8HLT3_9BURK
MNLRQLRNFIHIVDTGSITRTAHNIGIAQPALTLQIAQLEEELRTQLLLRSPRGVTPTAAGLMLYRQARQVLRQMEQLPHAVRSTAAELEGEVVAGFSTAMVPLFAAPLAACVMARHPRLKMRVLEGESTLLQEMVAHSRVDMAVLIDSGAVPTGLQHQVLCTLGVGLLCDGSAPDDVPGRPIALAEAARRVAAMPGPANPIRLAVEAALQQAGLPPPAIRLELNSLPALSSAVSNGLGPVFAPLVPLSAMPVAPGMHFRPVAGLEQALQACLCTSREMPVSLAAHAVQRALIEAVEIRTQRDDWPGRDAEAPMPAIPPIPVLSCPPAGGEDAPADA